MGMTSMRWNGSVWRTIKDPGYPISKLDPADLKLPRIQGGLDCTEATRAKMGKSADQHTNVLMDNPCWCVDFPFFLPLKTLKPAREVSVAAESLAPGPVIETRSIGPWVGKWQIIYWWKIGWHCLWFNDLGPLPRAMVSPSGMWLNVTGFTHNRPHCAI